MNYAKIVKFISWGLILIGVVIFVLAFVGGFSDSGVNNILYLTYAMVGLGLLSILGVGIYASATTDPKSLLRVGLVFVGAAALVAIVFALAPGNAPVGYHGEEPSHFDLVLTDAMLTLTYISVGAAILAILFGIVFKSIRDKK